MHKEFYTKADVARLFGINRDYLYEAIDNGHVDAPTHQGIPYGMRLHYKAEELYKILDQWTTWRRSLLPPALAEGEKLCSGCRIRIAKPDHKMCSTCLLRQKRTYYQRKAQGKCLNCGKEAISGKTKCRSCAARSQVISRKWWDTNMKKKPGEDGRRKKSNS